MKLRKLLVYYGMVGFSIYLLVLFFSTFSYWYLFSAIGLPILSIVLSSALTLRPTFGWIIALAAFAGYFNLEEPFNTVSLSFAIFMAGSRMARRAEGLDEDAKKFNSEINADLLHHLERLIALELVTTKFWENNFSTDGRLLNQREAEGLMKDLMEESSYIDAVRAYITNLYPKSFFEHIDIDSLIRMHCVGIASTLPVPFVRAKTGKIYSTGSRLIMDMGSSLASFVDQGLSKKQSLDYVISALKSSHQRTVTLYDNHSHEYGKVEVEDLMSWIKGTEQQIPS